MPTLSGQQAVAYVQSTINSSLHKAFEKLVGQLRQLRPFEIDLREGNCLNFKKDVGKNVSSTTIIVEPRKDAIRVHFFFENQSPRKPDQRLKKRGSKNKNRALYIEIKDPKDVDSDLLEHSVQAWEAH